MPDRLDIRPADPASDAIRPLLEAHLAHTSETSTPEACHALDLAGLQVPEIRFYAAFDGDTALGCGAIKDLGETRWEVKSVHVAASARGRGIAKSLMLALQEAAQSAGATVLLLETGSDILPPFDAARALYERLGYQYCEAFGDYNPHPESAFMRLDLKG